MTDITCAFTGHRPKSFPWKENETDPGCVHLKEVLAEQIKLLAYRGVTHWLSGMAQGVDLWAAEIVLDLKEKNPALHLHCILPCEGQERKWLASEREQYHSILRQADEVIYVNREYHDGCMLKRNRYLVDHSSVLLAVYNGSRRSGTGMTVRYAKRLGREVIVIDPVSRSVSCEIAEHKTAAETGFQKRASDASVNTLASCLLVPLSPNPVEQPRSGAGCASSGRLTLENL